MRVSSISNYIPHSKPIRPNYSKWCNEYNLELEYLFSIFLECTNTNIDIEYDPVLFNRFRTMIWNSSSKYIPKY